MFLWYREPRGFGFVKYCNAEDAAEAMKRMNHKVIGGREITIVFAEENRKTPQEMRTTNHTRWKFRFFLYLYQFFIVNVIDLYVISSVTSYFYLV